MKDATSNPTHKQPNRPRHCQHIMTNGEFCRALALRGRPYCHFHLIHLARRLRVQRRYEIAVNASIDPQCIPMDLPLLEDANSIQLALSHVVDALMNNSLDTKRAGLVLYALQTATLNLANGVDSAPHDGATVAEEYDNLEQDLQLGEDAPELKLQPAAPPPRAAARPPAPASSPASPPRPAPSRSQPDPALLNHFFDALPRPHIQGGKVVLRPPRREPRPAV